MSNGMLGLQGLVLGLGSVFLILILLIVFITLMGKLVQNSEKKKINKEPKVEEVKPTIVVQEDDEDEIIAAIAAAISCMAQQEGKKFRIRSYKRV